MASRWQDWFHQAEEDMRWLEDSLASRHFAQCCYIAQQVAEKALKAVALHRGALAFKSHSVVALAKSLAINSDIEKAGRILDRYYISGRYPDAFPEGIPGDFLDEETARSALAQAHIVLNAVRVLLPKGNDGRDAESISPKSDK